MPENYVGEKSTPLSNMRTGNLSQGQINVLPNTRTWVTTNQHIKFES